MKHRNCTLSPTTMSCRIPKNQLVVTNGNYLPILSLSSPTSSSSPLISFLRSRTYQTIFERFAATPSHLPVVPAAISPSWVHLRLSVETFLIVYTLTISFQLGVAVADVLRTGICHYLTISNVQNEMLHLFWLTTFQKKGCSSSKALKYILYKVSIKSVFEIQPFWFAIG